MKPSTIVVLLGAISLAYSCRDEFSSSRQCVDNVLQSHIGRVSQQQANAMSTCAASSLDKCVRRKAGLWYGMIKNTGVLKDPEYTLRTLAGCTESVIGEYLDDMENCGDNRHPGMGVGDAIGEMRIKVQNPNNDPGLRVLFMSVAILKFYRKLDCDPLVDCIAHAGVDVNALQRDMCRAKTECPVISRNCQSVKHQISGLLCQCYDISFARLEADRVNVPRSTIKCMQRQGFRLPAIAQKMVEQMDNSKGGEQVREMVCGKESFIVGGTMGLCTE